MKILFLAPEPFFQERGTPIAVRLAVEVLAQRNGDSVDLLTYHEGNAVEIPNVTQHRIWAPKWLKNIGPGISLRKLVCDVIFLISALRLVWANRNNQYDLLHAVEESVFIAWLTKVIFKIPYIYDMDSSLAMQVTEKWWMLRPLLPLFHALEGLAVKGSMAVVPVCDALAVIADRHGSQDTQILRDISLLDLENEIDEPEHLRASLGISQDALLLIYIGNLESYQGIDLLLEAFAVASATHARSHVVIIGGVSEHIEAYKQKASQLGIAERVHLVGPRPVSHLSTYLMQADILASPRTKGNNTPMKIYSYLHSGKAILATALPTHTQVLDNDVAQLAAPDPNDFSKALLELLLNETRRESVGKAARELAEREYTFEVFQQRLNELYDRVGKRMQKEAARIAA